MKHSSLFPKPPSLPGTPVLAGPLLNQIGATQGGSASFRAVASIPANLSNGRVYPTNGRGAGGGRPHASLSATAAHGVGDDAAAASVTPLKRSGSGLLVWLQGLFTAAAMGAIGYWMWSSAPKSARLAA